MVAYTLFSQTASGNVLAGDAAGYTFGVQFTVSQAATLGAIWWDSVTGAAALPATIALYAVAGTSLVHSEAASWSGLAASGWVKAAFAAPPSLSPSTSYKACVFYGGGVNWYSSTSHYWDSGSGSAGINNGPLSAPNNAGASGGQDTFTTGAALAYPASSFNATNYWVDLEVTPVAPAAGGLLLGCFP